MSTSLRASMRSTARYAVGVVLACTFPAQQDLQAQRQPATLDGTLGIAAAQTNRLYSAKTGLVVVGTFVPAHHGSRILAVSAGASTGGMSNDCVVAFESSGPCAPDFPPLTHIAVAAGFELGSSHLTARSTLGPAFYLSRTSGQSSGAGGQLTLDVAAGFTYFKGVVSGRYTVLRRKTETVRMPELDLGIRL